MNDYDVIGFEIDRIVGSATSPIVTIAHGTSKDARSYIDTGLSAGTTYHYWVTAISSKPHSDSDSAGPVSVTLLPAPQGLTATAISDKQINLSWGSLTGGASSVTGFIVERRPSTPAGSAFEESGRVANNKATSYADTVPDPGSIYVYRIKAYSRDENLNESYSTPSNEVRIRAVEGGGGPAAPSDLALEIRSATQITLTWKSNSTNETGFKIERREGSVSGVSSAGAWTEIGTTKAKATSFTNNSGLVRDRTYTYRVRAINNDGDSAYSNEASVTLSAPPAPANLKATRSSSTATVVDLSWSYGSGNVTDFKIERSKDGGNYGNLATVAANVRTYTDTKAVGEAVYTYRIRAQNKIGNSDFVYSDGGSDSSLSAPSNVTLEIRSATQVIVTWRSNSTNETGFKIERREGSGNFTEVGKVNKGVVTYTDSSLTRDRSYSYRVRASGNSGDSEYSNTASITMAVPSAPSNLTAVQETTGVAGTTGAAGTTGTTGQVRLTWRGNSSSGVNTTGFKIERRTGAGSFSQIATVNAYTESYTDNGLAPGLQYEYRVRAYNVVGDSAYSNEASVTISGASPPPGQQTPPPGQLPWPWPEQGGGVEEAEIRLFVNKSDYYVDGRLQTMDAPPIIQGGRTFLPIRYVAEAIGAEIEWNELQKKATITLNEDVIELWIGSYLAFVNGQIEMIDPENEDVQPFIAPPGRTMLPLRFVSESLGCLVEWDERTQEISIYYSAPFS